MSFPGEVWFIDPSSPLALDHDLFHDFILMVASAILLMVASVILCALAGGYINTNLYQNHALEAVWTVFPAVILLSLAVPSLTLLYMVEDFGGIQYPLVATGYQWFWKYDDPEPSDKVLYDLLQDPSSLGPQILGPLTRHTWIEHCSWVPSIPTMHHCGVVVTSSDVLHSWTLPALGVKVDAVPGRLNQLSMVSHNEGTAYGQCSELCGAYHSNMPITVRFWARTLSSSLEGYH